MKCLRVRMRNRGRRNKRRSELELEMESDMGYAWKNETDGKRKGFVPFIPLALRCEFDTILCLCFTSLVGW